VRVGWGYCSGMYFIACWARGVVGLCMELVWRSWVEQKGPVGAEIHDERGD
jgi:hypothetical protein